MLFFYVLNHTAQENEAELKARTRGADAPAASAAALTRARVTTAACHCGAQDKPSDREVEELLEVFEQKEAPLLRALAARVHWRTGALPAPVRAAVAAGAAAMCAANALARYYGSKCFAVRRKDRGHACCLLCVSRACACACACATSSATSQSFQINDSVACPSPEALANPRLLRPRVCLHGDAGRLVNTPGWVALGLFLISCACYRVRC